MTASLDTRFATQLARETVRSETRPGAAAGPVLLGDCATPLAGQTLLGLLWMRWRENEPEP